jgi:cobalt-zinc-cadmium efflux system membrane fusion protein
MSTRALGGFLQQLRRTQWTDAELLERWVAAGEQAAFEALLQRHGPMVLGLCRRVLRHEQDAEDAFQATFLALARKAGSIGRGEALAGWLYRVAQRIALRGRCRQHERAARHTTGVEQVADDAGPVDPDLRRVLDEEIARLPPLYRDPVVLCYLEGRTQEEAARLLGCPSGTLAWRLAQARARLRARLGRRGLAPAAWMAIITGGLRIMGQNKLKWVAAVLLMGVLGAGAALLARPEPEKGTDPSSLRLPVEQMTRWGIRTTAVRARETVGRRLTLSGSLAIPPQQLAVVRSRFPGEVVEWGTVLVQPKARPPATGDAAKNEFKDVWGHLPEPLRRPLAFGDAVKKGQLLAVIWSKDLGEKKSELIDALVKLHLDEKTLTNLKALAESGAGSEAAYRKAQNAVSADLNAIARARRTLAIWKVSKAEIEEIEKEADRIIASKTRKDLDKMKDQAEKWARVEVRARVDGVVVEKNLHPGDVVDTKTDLFKIADLRKLVAMVNVYPDDLALLRAEAARRKGRPIPWRVWLTGDHEAKALPTAGIERVSVDIVPRAGGGVAFGLVDNAGGKLRVGQSITATVVLPGRTQELIVPASAVVEADGGRFVFVQPDPERPVFAQRRVIVVRRGKDEVHLRADTLRPGERVVTTGALELQAELDDRRGQSR